MNTKNSEQRESLEYLRGIIKEGATVYTVLQNVSSNGMSRRITCHIIWNDSEGIPEVKNISHLVALALDYRYNYKHGALVIGGCGMDMGYHVVSSLASALGYTTKGAQSKGNCYGLNHKWI